MTDDLGARSPAARRVRAAIVAAAAVALNRDENASMQAVADAAGVGRATLYRHFPSRDVLLEAMWQVAIDEAGDSLRRANLGSVPPAEAVERATRALLTSAEHYAIVSRAGMRVDPAIARSLFVEPLTGVLRRGQEDGSLRSDVDAALLYDCWVGMIVRFGPMVDRIGVEDATDVIVRIFLQGARAA